MFCQKCGRKNEDDSKFCGACGASLTGGPAPSGPAVHLPLTEKIFLNKGGIMVSDAVFKTQTGSSYPVRNISSVSVTTKSASIIVMILVVILTLIGGLAIFSPAPAFGWVLLFMSAPMWWYVLVRPSHLMIGAGGVLQTAIESHDESQLQGVAKAINEAILYIQRGK